MLFNTMFLLINKSLTIIYRHGSCKRKVGNQGGLPRKKAVKVTVMLVDIGKLGKRGSGNLVLTYLANSQLMLSLTHLNKFSTLFLLDIPTYSTHH